MSGPSKVSGYTDKAMGAIKENVGYVFGNEQMEAEGKERRDKGEYEIEEAKHEERVKGTSEQIEGKTKEYAGKILNNEQMEYEGKAKKLQGDARKEANK